MPKVTEAHLEARRQQILDAASACFARGGFHQTTMHDVCQEAQLSPGCLYRYFESKEEIIEAIGEESRRRNRAIIEALGKEEETLSVFDDLVEAFFAGLDDKAGCVLDIEIWAEAVHNPRFRRILRRANSSVREPFMEIIRRAQERGDLRRDLDPEAVARAMTSFYLGLVLQKTIDGEVDVPAYIDAMKAMMSGSFWQGKTREGG